VVDAKKENKHGVNHKCEDLWVSLKRSNLLEGLESFLKVKVHRSQYGSCKIDMF